MSGTALDGDSSDGEDYGPIVQNAAAGVVMDDDIDSDEGDSSDEEGLSEGERATLAGARKRPRAKKVPKPKAKKARKAPRMDRYIEREAEEEDDEIAKRRLSRSEQQEAAAAEAAAAKVRRRPTGTAGGRHCTERLALADSQGERRAA